jgi:hypothetical protein
VVMVVMVVVVVVVVVMVVDCFWLWLCLRDMRCGHDDCCRV